MKKEWKVIETSNEEVEKLSNELKVPSSMGRLLVSIGIKDAETAIKFLKPNLNQMHNPFLLTDMKKAVKRIEQAIENKEKILGFGDYDADGVTTASVLKEGFRKLGVEIDIFVPNRFKDGYGLNPKRIKEFAEKYDLIISGDTGIRAFEAAKVIKEINHADLIITDHHEPHIVEKDIVDKEAERFGALTEIVGNEKIYLPDAFAVIDQQRLGDEYPNKSLAGVGVVFKLMHALFISNGLNMTELLYFLDLVAVGTIADLAKQIDNHNGKLDFENRVFSKYGISVMNQRPKPWVKAISLTTGIKKISDDEKKEIKGLKDILKEELTTDLGEENKKEINIKVKEKISDFQLDVESKYLEREPFFEEEEEIDAVSVGFRIGPTLNAPGRLNDPTPSVELLLERDEYEALIKSKGLKDINTKRQEQTKEYELVIKELEEMPEEHKDYGIVVQSENFHIGIAGLVAGKLQQHYYRPSIALAPVEKDGKIVLKGSCRSIPGIHILECLNYVKDKIGPYEYGGHEQAAGLTLEVHKFDEFRKAFREACLSYGEDVLTPFFNYYDEINLFEADENLVKSIALFEPFGEGMFKSSTKKPLFRTSNINIFDLKEIMNGKGCILTFEQNNYKSKGVMFRGGEEIISAYHDCKSNGRACSVDILYSPEFNYWAGRRSVQLMIEDIKLN